MATIIDRRMFAKGFAATAVATGAVALAGCSGEETPAGSGAASGTSYKIGVLQLTEHSALDAANAGFVKALDDSGITYEIEQQNAQNDQSACQTIAQTLVNDGCDLILAIATPAAQAVAGATSDIPIIGTAITDFAASDLVADQIDLLQKLVPEAKTVGLLYCTAESNSDIQIAMAKEELEAIGLTGVEFTVSSSNEIQSVVESMVGQVDAIYTPTDNTIAAAMTQVASIQRGQGSHHLRRGRHGRGWRFGFGLHQLRGARLPRRRDGRRDPHRGRRPGGDARRDHERCRVRPRLQPGDGR